MTDTTASPYPMPHGPRPPELWWTSTAILWRDPASGRLFDTFPDELYPALPDDAVRLVPEPPRPRVFFDGDTVPAGVHVMTSKGEFHPGLWTAWTVGPHGDGPYVEVLTDYAAEVARAKAEREAGR